MLFSLIVFSVVFVIGCQENSITDPVSTESINKSQIREGIFSRGTIPLEGILVQPGGFNSNLSIKGQIEFTHKLVIPDQDSSEPPYNVSLNLSVNAILTNSELPIGFKWHISENTRDNFYVSEDGIYILEKSFPVLDRKDGLVLVCRFLVTTDGIGLNAKWLALNNVELLH